MPGQYMIKKVLFLLIIFLQTNAQDIPDKIKLYTLYTPSHEIFLKKWFLPTLKDNYELVIEFHKQISPDGAGSSVSFSQTMLAKTKLILRGIHENWGECFIYSDVDIQFFKPTKSLLLSLLKDNDLIIQKGDPRGGLCAGFFMCKANEKTLKLWGEIKKYMINHPKMDDQETMELFLRNSNPFAIKWDYLPNAFYGAGIIKSKFWLPGDSLTFPSEDIVLHHATCTRGIQNKIKQLEYVKRIVQTKTLKKKNSKFLRTMKQVIQQSQPQTHFADSI